ncbi:non-canonical purine NTP pyrophosphatase [Geothermobacter hydrogeniphilus]|uniref:dITP/XTP pyrophosphatase n=1 Tax=Geothermobacter hydrogeniphilus TaxID=1969733 RepID=A0A2K2H8A4_9BACT|nr:XTP/dITP diphosphatase [Geothermobacter hydrogeniphilus]PNU19460.1 non-canonical purine NTP pyrophosphatase [Geothermobacter hydrogeniphilus]
MVKLVVATGNAGKLKEIRRLLADRAIEVLSLADFDNLPEIVEDGETFAANAEKKARIIAEATGLLTLADDSGLTVAALNGAPGVRSARFAGENAGDADNNRKLLNQLQGVAGDRRQAAFVCSMVLCSPAGDCRCFDGKLEGRILEEPRGRGGFGYDPLFWVDEQEATLAELPLDIKNRISHRGQALRALIDSL